MERINLSVQTDHRLFDARVKILSPRYQCENPYCRLVTHPFTRTGTWRIQCEAGRTTHVPRHVTMALSKRHRCQHRIHFKRVAQRVMRSGQVDSSSLRRVRHDAVRMAPFVNTSLHNALSSVTDSRTRPWCALQKDEKQTSTIFNAIT